MNFTYSKVKKKIKASNSINIIKTQKILSNKFKFKKIINTFLDKNRLIHYY